MDAPHVQNYTPPVADLLFYSEWLTPRPPYSTLATVSATVNPFGHRLGHRSTYSTTIPHRTG